MIKLRSRLQERINSLKLLKKMYLAKLREIDSEIRILEKSLEWIKNEEQRRNQKTITRA